MAPIIEMVKGVKALGMEACMTLGMLSDAQAKQLADAGLDYYNHNVDTSEEFYSSVVKTRSYSDRLDRAQRCRRGGAARPRHRQPSQRRRTRRRTAAVPHAE
jgi:biotin synthase